MVWYGLLSRPYRFLFLALFAFSSANAETPAKPHATSSRLISPTYGIEFGCDIVAQTQIKRELTELLKQLDVDPKLYLFGSRGGKLYLQLNTSPGDTNTLDFKDRPALKIKDEFFEYTDAARVRHNEPTVSKKEILLSMMQQGRTFKFEGDACSVSSLTRHISIRQRIARWGQRARWKFPNGPADFNPRVWDPKKGAPTYLPHEKVADLWSEYPTQIGCLTACKAIEVQGILDEFKDEPELLKLSNELLGENPLADIYSDVDEKGIVTHGKLLFFHMDVAPRNWVAGDWGYSKNTSRISSQIGGLEGSNTIYLGRGLFARFYPDIHPLERDYRKLLAGTNSLSWCGLVSAETISDATLKKVEQPPKKGGLLLDVRDFPRIGLEKELLKLKK